MTCPSTTVRRWWRSRRTARSLSRRRTGSWLGCSLVAWRGSRQSTSHWPSIPGLETYVGRSPCRTPLGAERPVPWSSVKAFCLVWTTARRRTRCWACCRRTAIPRAAAVATCRSAAGTGSSMSSASSWTALGASQPGAATRKVGPGTATFTRWPNDSRGPCSCPWAACASRRSPGRRWSCSRARARRGSTRRGSSWPTLGWRQNARSARTVRRARESLTAFRWPHARDTGHSPSLTAPSASRHGTATLPSHVCRRTAGQARPSPCWLLAACPPGAWRSSGWMSRLLASVSAHSCPRRWAWNTWCTWAARSSACPPHWSLVTASLTLVSRKANLTACCHHSQTART
mmetsp:Transcript_82202/g.228076  ORF Transcript_82202/g.228076 Transcript_82202/m.228076 type:complete len:345 (+) Transcript_82202:273-1307(+)